MTHIPDWASHILHLPPEERTEQQCRRLHALFRGVKSFDKFTEEIQMALCRAFTVDRLEEQRVVLKRGHVGQSFYLIYSGSVFVNAEEKSTDGQVFVRTVAVLSRGDSFGELALLQNITRTATVCVREKCELLVVEKDVFASVCPKIFEKQLVEKQNFLSKMTLFMNRWWTAEDLRQLSMSAQVQDYKSNKIIVADNSVEEWMYICMEGKCQVIRCLSLAAPVKSNRGRKTSDIVLSEELLQLLSTTPAVDSARSSHSKTESGDMKTNLLTSLGLDYVKVGKKLNFLDVNQEQQQQKRTKLGLDGATTLTEVMRRQKDNKDLVYLHVGELDAGHMFDIGGSLFNPPDPDDVSALMLVSSGAKILKLKKAAFFGQASDQAIEQTRVMAQKEGIPSEDVILDSYKVKVAWEDFKIDLVNSVVRDKERRNAPLYRSNLDRWSHIGNGGRGRSTSRILTALSRNQKVPAKEPAIEDAHSDDDSDNDRERKLSDGAVISRVGEANKSAKQKDKQNGNRSTRQSGVVIIRKKSPSNRSKTITTKANDLPRMPSSRMIPSITIS